MHTVVLNNTSDIVCRYETSMHYLELYTNLMFMCAKEVYHNNY